MNEQQKLLGELIDGAQEAALRNEWMEADYLLIRAMSLAVTLPIDLTRRSDD